MLYQNAATAIAIDRKLERQLPAAGQPIGGALPVCGASVQLCRSAASQKSAYWPQTWASLYTHLTAKSKVYLHLSMVNIENCLDLNLQKYVLVSLLRVICSGNRESVRNLSSLLCSVYATYHSFLVVLRNTVKLDNEACCAALA